MPVIQCAIVPYCNNAMEIDMTDTNVDITPYVAFEATGTDRAGRRNPCRRATLSYLRGLNYWTKSVWGILPSGKRKLLYRVYN